MAVAEVGIVYGTAPWVWMTMEPGSRDGVNLSLLQDVVGMPPYQVVGNLLVFAALGFFVPLRFPKLASVPRVMAVAAAGSLLIETLQYVLPLSRVSSLGDILLNSTGAGLAALASRRWWRGPSSGDTHLMDRAFVFEGPVVEWRGPAPFYFLAIPEEDSDDIKFAAKGVEYWGQVPVVASINGWEFTTALFPKDGRYLLPLKDAVRKRAEIERGQTLSASLRLGRA